MFSTTCSEDWINSEICQWLAHVFSWKHFSNWKHRLKILQKPLISCPILSHSRMLGLEILLRAGPLAHWKGCWQKTLHVLPLKPGEVRPERIFSLQHTAHFSTEDLSKRKIRKGEPQIGDELIHYLAISRPISTTKLRSIFPGSNLRSAGVGQVLLKPTVWLLIP